MSRFFKELNNKLSGNGNGALNVTTVNKTYYGRNAQYGTLRVTADGGASYSTVALTLKGYPEFVRCDKTRFDADANGIVTITGTSNSQRLIFAGANLIVTGAEVNGLNISSQWDGTTLTNIPDDPGKDDSYRFKITAVLSAASSAVTISGDNSSTTFSIGSSDSGSVTEFVTLYGLKGGNDNISYAGKSDTMKLESNVAWVIAEYPKSWISVDPTSGSAGSGNSLAVTIKANTGRATRQGKITARKDNVSPTAINVPTSSQNIMQQGKSLFVTITGGDMQKDIDSMDSEGIVYLTFQGITNAAVFNAVNFSALTGGISAEVVSVTLNGQTYEPEGSTPLLPVIPEEDYGQGGQYEFEFVVAVQTSSSTTGGASGNLTLSVKDGQASGSNTATATSNFMLVSSGTEFIELLYNGSKITSDTTISIDAAGGSEEIFVNTNIDWELEFLQ